jgi:hypothetical protein
MYWLWFVCTATIALVVGLSIGAAIVNNSMQPAIQRLNANMAGGHDFLLRVLRRELANWMFRRDPDRYLRIYKEAHEAAKEISAAMRTEQQAQLANLTAKYPHYADFDLINTRDHVLYADALNFTSFDQVERHFSNIVQFQALQIALDENWRYFEATRADDLAHLEKYVKQFKDARFKRRLQAAIDEYHAHRGDIFVDRDVRKFLCETATFSVQLVPNLAETSYGVHFKDTDEFGLYTIFFFDEPDKEPLIELWRTDSGFTKVIGLDDICIDEPV